MALSDIQIERVREITEVSTFDEARIFVEKLNEAQQTLVAADIIEWDKVRFSVTNVIANNQDNVQLIREEKRRLIRRSMRSRLGLPILSDQERELILLEQGGSGSGGANVLQRTTFRMQTGRNFKKNGEI